MGSCRLKEVRWGVKFGSGGGVLKIRAADAKEVGVGNPAEETCCHPNDSMLRFCNALSTKFRKSHWRIHGDTLVKLKTRRNFLHHAAAVNNRCSLNREGCIGGGLATNWSDDAAV
jgi:hypothetical protein